MKISPSLVAPFLQILYRIWCLTLRISHSGMEQIKELESSGQVIMFPIWHDELFPLPYVGRKLRLVSITSQSTDGEYVARLQESMGIRTVRGSSSRGGLKALLEAAKMMRNERYHCTITVDGPRGPRHVAKPGAVILAHRASARVLPVRAFMKKRKRFASWDLFQLPWPFSRVHVTWGEAYTIDVTDLSESSLAQECARMEQRLNALQPPEGFYTGNDTSLKSA